MLQNAFIALEIKCTNGKKQWVYGKNNMGLRKIMILWDVGHC